jgi:hypothetical protein
MLKLKKDTILYHTTDEEFTYRPNKQILFLTFHPSEWEETNDYVVRIRLKKDVELLYMISEFKKHFIFSSNEFDNFEKELRKLKLDGWLSSIDNKSQIEVAIMNDPEIFEKVSFENLKRDWRNGNNLNGKKSCKNWGKLYPISSRTLPVIFFLNIRYKKMIDEYIQFGLQSKYPFEYVFQVILENAIIHYHNEEFI